MKKILIIGATGLIGQHFVRAYIKHFPIEVMSRSIKKAKKLFPKNPCYEFHQLKQPGWVDQFGAIINLAGANIGDKRWSERRKQALINSRLDTTSQVVEAILQANQPPRLLNASAIGIYGYIKPVSQQMLTAFDEASHLPSAQSNFSTSLVQQWEATLSPLSKYGHPFVNLRFGVVLAPWGGALAKLLLPFKLGFGAKLGTGRQPFSWVSIDDVVRSIAFILADKSITGPVNIVSPEVLSQDSFAKQLAKHLKRPYFMWFPAWWIRWMFGQMGEELLLNGQYVKARVLQDKQFKYKHPTLKHFLNQYL